MNLEKYKQFVFSVATSSLQLAGLFLLLNGAPQTACADSTNLFVAPGGSGDCTQASPCNLQTALSAANDDDKVYLAEGVYTGSGDAVVTISRSIVLYGGWDGSATGPVLRDGTLHPSRLDGEDLRRVVHIDADDPPNPNLAPTIDGFIITGGNATGLAGGLGPVGSEAEAGGGIYSRNASPVIQNNLISNNVASTQPDVRAFGGGIYISSDVATAVIRNNQIVSNTAGIEIGQGDGGGLFVNGAAYVLGNSFQGNVACENCPTSSGSGGGVCVGWTTSEIVVSHNLFENNLAKRGGGIALVWSAVEVAGNTIIGNTATFGGGGLDSYYDKGSNIYANVVISNTAAGPGNGLRIYITKGPEMTRLVNNIIANNQGSSGAGLYAYSDWNLSAITLTHNTIANNGAGIKIGRNMTATLVNNILASHTVGIALIESTGEVSADHTLFWDNKDDGIRGDNPVDGDPVFVDPNSDDYLIGPGSAAIDVGVDAGVTTDIEGNPRPSGSAPDIGADEFTTQPFSCSGDDVIIDYDFQQQTAILCDATGSITTQGSVNIMWGADVSFQAGTEVILNPGFSVQPLAGFRASVIP